MEIKEWTHTTCTRNFFCLVFIDPIVLPKELRHCETQVLVTGPTHTREIRTPDACIFTTHHSRPSNKHLCFAVPKFFWLNYNILHLILFLDIFAMLKPDYVAPVVLYLCHDSCDSSGNVYECGAGWVAQGRITILVHVIIFANVVSG